MWPYIFLIIISIQGVNHTKLFIAIFGHVSSQGGFKVTLSHLHLHQGLSEGGDGGGDMVTRLRRALQRREKAIALLVFHINQIIMILTLIMVDW